MSIESTIQSKILEAINEINKSLLIIGAVLKELEGRIDEIEKEK